jgi:hypothetical protein
MANESKGDVERQLEDSGMDVVRLQKDLDDLEDQRGAPAAPADLEDQILQKTVELKAAQERLDALKGESV